MHITGQEYELADGSMALVEGTQTMRTWSEDWVLRRADATAFARFRLRTCGLVIGIA